jgi:hypothetical protein
MMKPLFAMNVHVGDRQFFDRFARSICGLAAMALFCLCQGAYGMSAGEWNARVFGHFEAAAGEDDLFSEDVMLGESALFITGRLSSKWSFLSEISYQPKRYRSDTVKVERLRLRYELSGNHWMSFGKMHTPVNEWNDAYHHGRLFFPTIDRPYSFGEFVPVHEVGLRLSGENLGAKRAFYDVVLGSGQSAHNDIFPSGVQSLTLSAGFWPTDDLKVRASLYKDTLIDHFSDSSHGSDHHGGMMGHMGPEDLAYDAFATSAVFQGRNIESMTEVFLFRSEGSETSWTAYQRLAFPLSGTIKPYVFGDVLKVDRSEFHFAGGHNKKAGVGIEWLLGTRASAKFEYAHQDVDRQSRAAHGTTFRVQLAFGI